MLCLINRFGAAPTISKHGLSMSKYFGYVFVLQAFLRRQVLREIINLLRSEHRVLKGFGEIASRWFEEH